MNWTKACKANTHAWFVLGCSAGYVALAIVVHQFFLDHVLELLYGGKLFAMLMRLRRHQDPLTFSTYLVAGRLLFSRLSFLVVLFSLILAAFLARQAVRRVVVDFFTTPTSPVNLAIFRIVVFGVTLRLFCGDYAATAWFSTFPPALQVAPYGLGWVLPHIPISPTLVHAASVLLIVFCVTGIAGLFGRISALLAALSGLYVMGITQFYGKVSHDHECLWFLALLAAGPCSDALAVDAIFSAKKSADHGITSPPQDSLAFALPLRFASLLLGLIYFFPGFWKFWSAGFDWALSDNLKYQMYSKWTEFNGWTPFFRLDQHPWLYRSMAFGTLCLELSFVFLIFVPQLRRIAALGGAAFHIGSYFFLRIFFYDLIGAYVALFDVSGALRKCGARLFKTPLTVFYDDDCSFCRRAIAVIQRFDVLGAIHYARARQDSQLYLATFPSGDTSLLLDDMHAVCGHREYIGARVYRAMSWRIPLFWPLIPFWYLPPVRNIADKIYRRVSHARVCQLVGPRLEAAVAPPSVEARSNLKLIAGVGCVLVAGSFYTGIRGIVAGWPFACFPTFAYIARDHIDTLQILALTANGDVLSTDEASLRTSFSDQRLRALLERTLIDPGEANSRLRGVWQLYTQKDGRLKEAATVRFYRVTVCTIPDQQKRNPLNRQLLAEISQ
jgi:predicted DCC family thiol-disulfide oxidoreductase YuxK